MANAELGHAVHVLDQYEVRHFPEEVGHGRHTEEHPEDAEDTAGLVGRRLVAEAHGRQRDGRHVEPGDEGATLLAHSVNAIILRLRCEAVVPHAVVECPHEQEEHVDRKGYDHVAYDRPLRRIGLLAARVDALVALHPLGSLDHPFDHPALQGVVAPVNEALHLRGQDQRDEEVAHEDKAAHEEPHAFARRVQVPVAHGRDQLDHQVCGADESGPLLGLPEAGERNEPGGRPGQKGDSQHDVGEAEAEEVLHLLDHAHSAIFFELAAVRVDDDLRLLRLVGAG
mmetsp:Transcript_84558/g.262596  ORF Transcript_84558/g.262596 Transcript_84558/m.262596 type:complete len:283 (+) Transcript_84558:226-1074(+)